MLHTLPVVILTLPLVPAARAQGVELYATDFTDPVGWTLFQGCELCAFWAFDHTPGGAPGGGFLSPPRSLNFNNGASLYCTDSFGYPERSCGWARSAPIDLSLASDDPRLRFWVSWYMEPGCQYDVLNLFVRSASGGPACHATACLVTEEISGWRLFEIELDRECGAVQIEFAFDTVDGYYNHYPGVFIDDLEVVAVGSLSCFGDGSVGPCPCGNESDGAQRAGCKHSGGTGGALRTSGRASLSDDTLVLQGSAMPNQPVMYFQGASSIPATPFGDGLRCVGQPIVRLGTKQNSGGASSFPGPADPSISVRGMVAAPGIRHYCAWFRDPAAFCTIDTFGLTNAVTIVWEP